MALDVIVSPAKPKGKPTTPPNHKQFLNPLQAAEFLGVSHQTMARWRMLKVGPDFSRLNNFTIRYSVEDLLAYATAKKVHHAEK